MPTKSFAIGILPRMVPSARRLLSHPILTGEQVWGQGDTWHFELELDYFQKEWKKPSMWSELGVRLKVSTHAALRIRPWVPSVAPLTWKRNNKAWENSSDAKQGDDKPSMSLLSLNVFLSWEWTRSFGAPLPFFCQMNWRRLDPRHRKEHIWGVANESRGQSSSSYIPVRIT